MEDTDYIIREFRKAAWFYDSLAWLIWQARKYAASLIPKESRVLDVCCGTGLLTIQIKKRGCKVIGIDISPDMLRVAKRKYDIDFSVQDATKMPFRNREFDYATISMALHDMPEKTAINVLREMKRVSKKIIVIDYDMPDNLLVRWGSHTFCSLFETKYYEGFLKKGLDHYISGAKINTQSRKSFMLGTIQVRECGD